MDGNKKSWSVTQKVSWYYRRLVQSWTTLRMRN